jgi:hypothetical protein
MYKENIEVLARYIVDNTNGYEPFSINNILLRKGDPTSSEEKEVFFNTVEKLIDFGRIHRLYVAQSKDKIMFELTERGIDWRQSGKPFRKFNKPDDSKSWYNSPWVNNLIAFLGVIVAAISIAIGIYQFNKSEEQATRISELQEELIRCQESSVNPSITESQDDQLSPSPVSE